jgi:predicted enzyme related to lactoylglutathione lyase
VAVPDLERALDEIAGRGLDRPAIETVAGAGLKAPIVDPEGNTITFLQVPAGGG